MKDIELNPLNKGQRKLLQWGVLVILCVFLAGYFFFISRKNTTIYLENHQNLHVFDESMIFEYPDRLSIHYPYLFVIQPERQKTQIYNLESKKKEREVHEIVLDYQNGKTLINKGNKTYLDKKDLKTLCEKGIIKNEHEVLCVTKVNSNGINNKIVSINPDTQKNKDLYTSKYIISDVNFIDKSYYIGEIDPISKKTYLIINGLKAIETPNIVSVIYEMNDRVYFGAFKSVLNKQNEGYYEIIDKRIIEQSNTEIVFYK